MSDDVIWIKNRDNGRLEREIFGSTPFANVPESPYYVPSPGHWTSVRAWFDDDSRHVVIAHDCVDTREIHILPWPTWQAIGMATRLQVDPSYNCEKCRLYARTCIDWEQTSVLPAVSHKPGETR